MIDMTTKRFSPSDLPPRDVHMTAVRRVLSKRRRLPVSSLVVATRLSRNQVLSALDGLLARNEIAYDEKSREVWLLTVPIKRSPE